MLPRLLLTGLIGALAVACGSPTTPSAASTSTSTAQFAVTAISPGTSSVSGFAVAGTSTVKVALASIVSAATGDVIPVSMTLGLGTASGATCTIATSVGVTPSLSTQISTSLSAGNYCVKVTDTGSLPEAATVAVRITTITNPTTPQATSLSDVFSSELGVKGFASRTFNIAVAGDLTLSLTNLGGAGPPVVRLGVGAWDGAACRLNTSADVTAGGSIILTADSGAYCVRVSDIGNLTGPVSFIVNVNHS